MSSRPRVGVGLALALQMFSAVAADGDLDAGFGTAGKVQVPYAGTSAERFSDAAGQANGSILVAGVSDVDGAQNHLFIATLAANGAVLAKHLIPLPGTTEYNRVTVTETGEILVSGGGPANAEETAFFGAVYRYNASGVQTGSFTYPPAPTPSNSAYGDGTVLREASGKYMVPFTVLLADKIVRPALLRLNADLTLDTSAFGGDGIALGSPLGNDGDGGFADGEAVIADGAGGYYVLNESQSENDEAPQADVYLYVQHYLSSGALDTVFGDAGIATVDTLTAVDGCCGFDSNEIFRDSSGRLVIGAQIYGNNHADALVARLLGTGDLDASFGTGGVRTFSDFLGYSVFEAFQDSADRLYIVTSNRIVRLTAAGATDGSLDTDPSDVNFLNAPAGCVDSGCYSSQWQGGLLLPDGKSALLVGGVSDYSVESGQTVPENAIVAKVRLDDPPDSTPNPFSFTDQTGVPVGSTVTSNSITVGGINTGVTISISGDASSSFSINGGSFSNATRTVFNGDTVQVRHTAAAAPSTTVTSYLEIGGLGDGFSSTTAAADTTPDAFSFADVTGATTGVDVISSPITVSGITAAAPIGVTGGAYSVNGGTFVTGAGAVGNGATVRLRVRSSASAGTGVTATLTIGGVADPWTVTTGASDTSPNSFRFVDRTGMATGTVVFSNIVTISGISAPVPITISGGSATRRYQINGGEWVSTDGTVSNGDTVRVRIRSPSAPNATFNLTTMIGNVVDVWQVTTGATDTTPSAFEFTDLQGVTRNTTLISAPVTPAGFNAPVTISVSGAASRAFSINGAEFGSAPATLNPGDSVRLRVTSSTGANRSVKVVVNIGGTTNTWIVRTGA